MKKKVNIIVAEDVEIYLDGLLLALQQIPLVNVIDVAENGEQLIRLVDKHQPDLIISDIEMPVMGGIDACRIITSKYPHMLVIATTIFEEESLIINMLEAGATSFVMKNAGKAALQEAITTTMQGQAYFCKHTNRHITRYHARMRQKAKQPQFSPREIEIIKLICQDLQHDQIAKKLCLSKATIDITSHRILQKMNEHTAVGMMNYALKHGLIDINSLNS